MTDIHTYDSIREAWAHHPGLDADVLQVVLRPGTEPGGAWKPDLVAALRQALEDMEAPVTLYITASGRVYLASTEAMTAVLDLREPVPDLVAAADIAARAGVQVVTVHRWRERHPGFPSPLATTSGGAVWRWEDVLAWLEETGRGRVESGIHDD